MIYRNKCLLHSFQNKPVSYCSYRDCSRELTWSFAQRNKTIGSESILVVRELSTELFKVDTIGSNKLPFPGSIQTSRWLIINLIEETSKCVWSCVLQPLLFNLIKRQWVSPLKRLAYWCHCRFFLSGHLLTSQFCKWTGSGVPLGATKPVSRVTVRPNYYANAT